MGSSETTGQDHASPSVVNDLKEVLPPLSSQEHAIYNSAAEHMNMFVSSLNIPRPVLIFLHGGYLGCEDAVSPFLVR